eukprot:CAMPEP_0202053082 /NCGR_PEP_ID=MMETSP0963-20130614/5641_1 /ASSEMBLY_ACC=CAM_ASM_000494 /TAXON_ID=4773 /ORGANISM="Schizochytrium aggregatum, Strain ATCC28209" /LENGTH=461 /DNA_ID=CAMNT_0048618391 /DNA_START=101 /DNA_END=1488 /DNA_ORIENTATION=-
MAPGAKWLGLLAVVAAATVRGTSAVAESTHVALPAGSTWANLAWGFDDGGRDSTDGVDVVLVDIDIDQDELDALKGNAIIMCYISAGTIEPYRDDYKSNKAAWDALALGRMSNWDEAWLDIRQRDAVIALMIGRLQQAKAKGCQAVEPDNIDCFDNRDCWGRMDGVSRGRDVFQAQLDYNAALVAETHKLGMAMVVKNAAGVVEAQHEIFDGAVTENCVQYDECDIYNEYFTSRGKAHFATEYDGRAANCGKAYPGMQMKYCESRPGNYLCRDSVDEWQECGPTTAKPTPSPTTPAPTASPTTYSEFYDAETQACAELAERESCNAARGHKRRRCTFNHRLGVCLPRARAPPTPRPSPAPTTYADLQAACEDLSNAAAQAGAESSGVRLTARREAGGSAAVALSRATGQDADSCPEANPRVRTKECDIFGWMAALRCLRIARHARAPQAADAFPSRSVMLT